MLTTRQYHAYADFFARVPGTLVFVGVMSFWITYLELRGQR